VSSQYRQVSKATSKATPPSPAMIIQIWRRSLSELESLSSLASVVVELSGSCWTPLPGTNRFWVLTSVMFSGCRVVGGAVTRVVVVSAARVVLGRAVVSTGGSDVVVVASVVVVVDSVVVVVEVSWRGPPGPPC
jgi:hypothetical protein